MKFEVRLVGKGEETSRAVEVERQAGGVWRISVDGQPVDADVVEIAPHTLSVLLRGQSHEIRVAQSSNGSVTVQTGLREFTAEILDPRSWRGRRASHHVSEGRQQIIAPMAGKVVRLLVQLGDVVEAKQGLLVVEAMKMQNEIRSTRSGTVEKLLVAPGETVSAGDVLAWIT